MNHTQQTDRALYLNAHAQFESILRSRKSTTQQKRAALDAMDDLDRDYLSQAAHNLQQSTAQMQQFITLIEDIVAALEAQQQPLDAIDRLREIIEQANHVLRE